MIWYLIVHQPGGCDYTIDCGTAFKVLSAATKEEAIKKAEEIITEDYDGTYRLDKATLIKAEKVVKLDVDKIYE